MKILHYQLQTAMGQITSHGDQLDFLTEDELKELNHIGHTGKDFKGVKTKRTKYLNGLKKYGTFSMVQTKRDNGDFVERFNVVRVII